MASLRIETVSTTATLPQTINGLPVGARRARFSPSKSSMRAVTKKRPIEILMSAHTPQVVLKDLKERYAYWLNPGPGEDEMVEVSQTAEYKEFETAQTPGSWLSGLREAIALTQKDLGRRLGGVSSGRISDWENNRRAISKEYAKALSKVFGVSAEHFL